MNRFYFSLLVLCMMILPVFGCRKHTTTGEGYIAGTIRIEQNTSLNSFLATVMKDNKILEKYLPNDVFVEYINTSSGKASNVRDALISGNVDNRLVR